MSTQLPELPNDFERVLAVVAHPDDLEYGASGAIAVWADAGTTVAYLLVTRGEAGIDGLDPAECGPLREAEQVAAAKRVGVDVVEFLDHRDGVIEHDLELRRDIAAAIRRHRPEVVVVINFDDTWFGQHWNSPDHRNTGRATLDAIGDAGNRWIFPEQVADGLEPWDGVRMIAVSGSSEPTHAVPIEDGLERAIASLEAHTAYLDALSGDMADARTFLTDMATSAGKRFGGRPAALFRVFGA
ncbi:PIG-L deacetylase family protein [Ilumatobacter nonamiensis]|uniref:PIG-L deacetylase family protein n=1 Tax=Ilumatobacter nonamiensis TaxID=467093 RepID=UPI00034AB262|nr:PIG-L deacetylase family protein [Ilumatobacter nonamiensis]